MTRQRAGRHFCRVSIDHPEMPVAAALARSRAMAGDARVRLNPDAIERRKPSLAAPIVVGLRFGKRVQ